jgi:glyoxylase-like metal-dependent hydrolase (beta-lactamase superfamily II)
MMPASAPRLTSRSRDRRPDADAAVATTGGTIVVMEIAPRIRRIGRGMVNSYLVEEAGAVTIIDAGAPSYWGDLPRELAAMGRTLDDVRAVVLTHGHSDHIGFAERIRRERGVPIQVHELDAALARGEVPNPAKGMGPARLRPLFDFIAFSIRHGMLRIPRIKAVATFGDGATLDVPGSPRVILVPGHTPGSAALHVPSHDALFAGDALATLAVTTGLTGPRIAPFTADPAEALESLRRLDGLEAGYLLPGHGQAWTGGVGEAIRLVRASVGPTGA